MNRAPFVSVREVLASPLTAAGRLMALGRRLGNANEALLDFLEAPLRDHVTIARLTGDTLTLVADSPAWAARVRYQGPQILDHMRSRLDSPRLGTMRIITRPTPPIREPEAPPSPRCVSPQTAELIESVALGCDNEALGRILLRLASRAKTRPND